MWTVPEVKDDFPRTKTEDEKLKIVSSEGCNTKAVGFSISFALLDILI